MGAPSLSQTRSPLERPGWRSTLPAKNDSAVASDPPSCLVRGQPSLQRDLRLITAQFLPESRAYQPRPEFTQKFTYSDVVIDST